MNNASAILSVKIGYITLGGRTLPPTICVIRRTCYYTQVLDK